MRGVRRGMGALNKVAGVVCIALLVGVTGLAGYVLMTTSDVTKIEFAKNALLLVTGATVGVVTGLFAEARDRIIYETPASFKSEITIKSTENGGKNEG